VLGDDVTNGTGRRIWVGLSGLALLVGLAAAAAAADGPGLAAFASPAELEAVLAAGRTQTAPAIDPKCPPELEECRNRDIEEVVVTGSRIASGPSVTNNQEAGVDEGDIVKARGDTLIVLRRGRLFSVSTAHGGLRAVDSIDAYPPGVEPDTHGDWYDEMLVSGDWVIVIGYTYQRGGTEINRFRMDAAGRFSFIDSHHLTSEDYYSSRNYASRLIGEELVLYTPVDAYGAEPLRDLPMLSRWSADRESARKTVVPVGNIYRSPEPADQERAPDTLHTVVRCDLTAVELACGGVAILGARSRNYYVAPTAVYIWMADGRWDWLESLPKGEEPPAWFYRVPLDGGAPRVAATRGVPIDQFSFREDSEAESIAVMVVSQGRGEGMWGAESARGRAALVTLPFERFGDGSDEPEDDDYRILPALQDGYEARNRFVGDHLLYSSTAYWDSRRGSADEDILGAEGVLTIVPLEEGPIRRFMLPGRIGRIEEMGRDAMVVTATDDDMVFTTIGLTGPRPVISDQFVMLSADESEERSHAFYFMPDPDSPDGSRGVLGLPVFRGVDEGRHEIGAVAFLRRGGGRLSSLGSLDATPGVANADDGCQASCYDWYGDARPIFLGGRVFGLLGYEIVEGRERAGRLRELRRIDITPPTPPGPRPYYPD